MTLPGFPPRPHLLVLGDPAAPYLRALERVDAASVTIVDDAAALPPTAADAEAVLVCMRRPHLLRQVWPKLTAVRWVHSMMAGLDTLLFPELVDSDVTLTNARGVYARNLAEYVVAAILYAAKDMRRLDRQQATRAWEPFPMRPVAGRRLLIIGYGEIGRALARRAMALDLHVVGIKRHPTEEEHAERTVGPAELERELAGADIVVNCTPLTPETRHLFNADRFACMKRGAWFINVGRGGSVDEHALLAALDSGQLEWAVLDVFEAEPLPSDSPLWSRADVLISPHNADITTTWLDESMELFVDNAQRASTGRPLRNVVRKQLGY